MRGDSPDTVTRPATLSEVPARPGAPKPDPLLIATTVHRSFGGLRAVRVEKLELQRGAITALIGPNGAGKTTLFNVLTGFDRAGTGQWAFDGYAMGGLPAHRVARRGVVRTFQLTKALARLTVLENLQLAATQQRGENIAAALLRPLWRQQEEQARARAAELLQRFRLDHLADAYAGTLSGGQRKLLELARALMVRPKLLMLDEPMAGVNPVLAQSLLQHITDLRDEGMTVCFVEHDMDMVMGTSDWVVCMAEGEVIAEGPPRAIGTDQAVVDAYLGRAHGGAPEGELPEGELPEEELPE